MWVGIYRPWSISMMIQKTTLPGDILLVCAFISYVGCFTKQYRLDLLNKSWMVYLKNIQVCVNKILFMRLLFYWQYDNFVCSLKHRTKLILLLISQPFVFQPKIPTTEGLDPLEMLTDDTQIAIWQNEGLPADRMSTENATILCNSIRWPLMIDPQVEEVIYSLFSLIRY